MLKLKLFRYNSYYNRNFLRNPPNWQKSGYSLSWKYPFWNSAFTDIDIGINGDAKLAAEAISAHLQNLKPACLENAEARVQIGKANY